MLSPPAFADEPKPVSDVVTTDCTRGDPPDVAAGPHGFLAVWAGWGMRLDPFGRRIDGRRFPVGGDHVVWFRDRYFAIGGGGAGSVITEDGTVSPFTLPFSNAHVHGVAASGDYVLIVYFENKALRLLVVDSNLAPVYQRVVEDDVEWWEIDEVAVSSVTPGFLIAYTRADSLGWPTGTVYRTWTRSLSGLQLSERTLVAEDNSGSIELASSGDRALLVVGGSARFLDPAGSPISTPIAMTEGGSHPRLVWTGTEYLMVCLSRVGNDDRVAVIRFDPVTGWPEPAKTVFADGNRKHGDAIAAGGDSIVIVWSSFWRWSGVTSIAWDRQFVPRLAPQVLSLGYASQQDPVTASLYGVHLLAWNEGRCGSNIVVGRIGEQGEALDGSGYVLTRQAETSPRLFAAADSFFVLWSERAPSSESFSFAQRLTKGIALYPRIDFPPGFIASSIVENPNHADLLVVGKGNTPPYYYTASAVVAKRLLHDGSLVDGATIQVADERPDAIDVAASDDGYLVVFDDRTPPCQFLCPVHVTHAYAQRLDLKGNAVGNVIWLAADASDPDVRWTGSDFLVTWSSSSSLSPSSPLAPVFIRKDGTVSLVPSIGATPYVENLAFGFRPSVVATFTDGVMSMVTRARLDPPSFPPQLQALTMNDGSLRAVYVTDVPPTTGSSRLYSRAIPNTSIDIGIRLVNPPSRVNAPGFIGIPIVVTNKSEFVATSVDLTVSCDYSGVTLSGPEWMPELQPGESRTITARFWVGQGVTTLWVALVGAERDPAPDDNFIRHDIILSWCGDVNGDGWVTAPDVFFLCNYILYGTGAPFFADINGDGAVTMADVFYLVNFVYRYGPQPVCP